MSGSAFDTISKSQWNSINKSLNSLNFCEACSVLYLIFLFLALRLTFIFITTNNSALK